MGARHAEFALGLWLLVSPFVFGHVHGRPGLLATDLVCGTLLMVVSLLCYAPRLRRAHLSFLLVATWLTATGWWAVRQGDLDPARQNHVVVGLLLAMIAIVPSRAAEPPSGWPEAQEQYRRR